MAKYPRHTASINALTYNDEVGALEGYHTFQHALRAETNDDPWPCHGSSFTK